MGERPPASQVRLDTRAEFSRRLFDYCRETRADLVCLAGFLQLIVLVDGVVSTAYPFSGQPTPFVVRLANGDERFSCCATDALGIAAMLRQRIEIRSRCHHCGEPLTLVADPSGPEPTGAGTMVWVGKRAADDRRACTSL